MRRGWLAFFVMVLPQISLANGREDASPKDSPPWAFQTPVRPPLPKVKKKDWVRNPIDAFILARLEEDGLTPSPEAERIQLIRRLTFDLTGLPPTPEEIDAFLQDSSPRSYEKVVERLLASPRYGERWAMYWLDLVRFAESDGFKADDIRPTAWRYRDYVIRAFNEDRPFDRFVREQIAGDELYPDDPQAIVATAFNRHFPDEYNARNLEQRRQEILNDMTDTTGQVFLGLTVGCARCHNHKFDPITQKDYYRLQAFYAAFWARDDLPAAGRKEQSAYLAKQASFAEHTQDLQRRLHDLEEPYYRKVLAPNKIKYPRPIQEAYDTPPPKRTPLQKQLAFMVGKQLQVKREQMARLMKPEVRKEWQDLINQMARLEKEKPASLPVTMGITDVATEAPATHVLKRGNWRRPGEEVQPGVFAVFQGKQAGVPAASATSRTTGRRSALASWLTHPENPLTARVLVNRLWQHHFGKGIVGTPSDFGVMGDAPSHPELLDWLACEFMARGWSLKAVHRLMVTSATYRQAGQWRKEAAKVDPDNRLLWRMNRRRLEGEALRDAMLAVSGQLNLKAGGPSIFPELPAEVAVPRGGWPVTADPKERNRRSIYVFVKRNLRYPFFAVLDAPDSNETCARRHLSTTAPQALMLVNGKFTQDMARAFAGRLLNEGPPEPASLVERAYRLALGRLPDGKEITLAVPFLRQGRNMNQTLVDFCHVLLNLNEFAYVE